MLGLISVLGSFAQFWELLIESMLNYTESYDGT